MTSPTVGSEIRDGDETQAFHAVLNENTNRGWFKNSVNRATVNETGAVSPYWTVTSRVDGVHDLLECAETDMPSVVPDWSIASVKVKFFEVKNGEIDLRRQIGLHSRVTSKTAMNILMKKVSKLSLSRMYHYATLGEYMHNLYKRKKLLDVVVRVKDQIFAAHRHVLSCHSQFFARLFTSTDVPAYAVTDVTLYDVTTEAFSQFMHFIHIGDVYLTPYNVSILLDLSLKLQSDSLRAQILVYMSKRVQFSVPEAVMILSGVNEEDDERPEAVATIGHKFQEIIQSPLILNHIEVEDFKNIIGSEYVNINSELDIFWAVLYWVSCDKRSRQGYLPELMQLVRFGTMSTLELMDCARASSMIRSSDECKDLLVQGNWYAYMREKGIKDPLKMPQQYPRLIIQELPRHETTVFEFDMRYMLYKKLIIDVESMSSRTFQKTESEEDRKHTKKVRFATHVQYAPDSKYNEIKPKKAEHDHKEHALTKTSSSTMSVHSESTDFDVSIFGLQSQNESENPNAKSEQPNKEKTEKTTDEKVEIETPREEPTESIIGGWTKSLISSTPWSSKKSDASKQKKTQSSEKKEQDLKNEKIDKKDKSSHTKEKETDANGERKEKALKSPDQSTGTDKETNIPNQSTETDMDTKSDNKPTETETETKSTNHSAETDNDTKSDNKPTETETETNSPDQSTETDKDTKSDNKPTETDTETNSPDQSTETDKDTKNDNESTETDKEAKSPTSVRRRRMKSKGSQQRQTKKSEDATRKSKAHRPSDIPEETEKDMAESDTNVNQANNFNVSSYYIRGMEPMERLTRRNTDERFQKQSCDLLLKLSCDTENFRDDCLWRESSQIHGESLHESSESSPASSSIKGNDFVQKIKEGFSFMEAKVAPSVSIQSDHILSLLDRREIEMSLISPPLLQPEVSSDSLQALVNMKKRRFYRDQ